jgi:hypothetical protein
MAETGTSRPDAPEGPDPCASLVGVCPCESRAMAAARVGGASGNGPAARAPGVAAPPGSAERPAVSRVNPPAAVDVAKSCWRNGSSAGAAWAPAIEPSPCAGDAWAWEALAPVGPPGESFPASVKRGQKTANMGTPSVMTSTPIDRHFVVREPSMAKSDSFRLSLPTIPVSAFPGQFRARWPIASRGNAGGGMIPASPRGGQWQNAPARRNGGLAACNSSLSMPRSQTPPRWGAIFPGVTVY